MENNNKLKEKRAGRFKLYRTRIAAAVTAIAVGVGSSWLNSMDNEYDSNSEKLDTFVTNFDSSDGMYASNHNQFTYNSDDNVVIIPPRTLENNLEVASTLGISMGTNLEEKIQNLDNIEEMSVLSHNHVYSQIEVEYKDNHDGTHTREIIGICSQDGEKKVLIKEMPTAHTVREVVDVEGHIIGEGCMAPSCGYKVVKENGHQYEITETYEDLKNGTHRKVTTKICTELDCPEEERKIIIYGKEEPHTLKYTYDRHGRVVKEECLVEGCEYQKKYTYRREREYRHGHKYEVKTYHEDMGNGNHRLVTIETCTEPGCPENEREFITYGKEESHVLEYTYDEQGRILNESCHCGYQKIHTYEHNHKYEVKTYHEDMGNGNHRLVTIETCTEPGCPENEREIITYGKEESHALECLYDEQGRILNESCHCGYQKTYTYGHSHKYDAGTYQENMGNEGHRLVTIKNCTEPGCPKDEKNIIIYGEIEAHRLVEVEDADRGVIGYECSCGYYKELEQPPLQLIPIDVSSIDPNSLIFEYDGNPHLPIISGIPENVIARYVSIPGTNAGEYICRIEFDVPEGYIAEPIEIPYTIKPAKVSFDYEYDETTGELNAIYTGIVSDDIKTNYTVNGEELTTGTPKLDEYGVYKVQSSIEIDPDKRSNYDFSEEDLSKSTIYQVKRENTWFDIDTEYKENDGKIVIDVLLSASKLPYFTYYDEELDSDTVFCMPVLTFNLYFDEKQLQYVEKELEGDDDIYNLSTSEGWEGCINTEFKHSEDVVISPGDEFEYYDGLPERVKICQLAFNKLTDDKDIIIRIDGAEMSTGSDDYPFLYKTDASVCVINPSNVEKPVETIARPNDLQDDAIFTEGSILDFEEEEYRDTLQEFIENGFQFPSKELSDEENAQIMLEEKETDINNSILGEESNISDDSSFDEENDICDVSISNEESNISDGSSFDEENDMRDASISDEEDNIEDTVYVEIQNEQATPTEEVLLETPEIKFDFVEEQTMEETETTIESEKVYTLSLGKRFY